MDVNDDETRLKTCHHQRAIIDVFARSADSVLSSATSRRSCPEAQRDGDTARTVDDSSSSNDGSSTPGRHVRNHKSSQRRGTRARRVTREGRRATRKTSDKEDERRVSYSSQLKDQLSLTRR
jgi:hypothetical protein